MTLSIRKIALVRALHLGDLLVAVPALRALRAGFPEAEITLISLPWAAEFCRRMSAYIDRFVEFPGYAGIGEVAFDPERTETFVREQRAYAYDLVIQMHGSGKTSTPFALALAGRATVAYYDGDRPHGLTLGAPYPRDEPEVFRNLNLVLLTGCPDTGTALEFPLSQEDVSEASELLATVCKSDLPLVGLHPGAKRPAQRWPANRFAAVADTLARRYGAQVVLTGGPDERDTVAAVARFMTTVPLQLAGKTSIGGLGAVISRLDLFVSNDTGPAHIAEALGTPSVTLFGPAEYQRWMPLDTRKHRSLVRPVSCSPCSHWDCPIDHRCLREIETDAVVSAAEAFLPLGAPA